MVVDYGRWVKFAQKSNENLQEQIIIFSYLLQHNIYIYIYIYIYITCYYRDCLKVCLAKLLDVDDGALAALGLEGDRVQLAVRAVTRDPRKPTQTDNGPSINTFAAEGGGRVLSQCVRSCISKWMTSQMGVKNPEKKAYFIDGPQRLKGYVNEYAKLTWHFEKKYCQSAILTLIFLCCK